MIRDITLGQYYQTESFIHKLDPRTKLLGTMIFLVSLFIKKNIVMYVLAALFLAFVIKVSHVPFRFVVRGIKAIVMLLIITAVFNVFLMPGDVIFTWWKIKITMQGVENAIVIIIRLLLLIVGSSMMTLTTTPNELTDGLERVLRPFKIFHLPVHEIAMMMAIALRFIPILIEETDKIMKAQMARGADFEHGSLITKAKNMVPLLVPLFVSAFRRANDLAMAMEARCYRGGEGRTKMKPLCYKKRDVIAYTTLFGYLALQIGMAIVFHMIIGKLPFTFLMG